METPITSQDPPQTPQQSIKSVADLLLLQQRLRGASSLAELAALVVNDTRVLFPYWSAVFWHHGKVEAVSGLHEPARQSSFIMWVSELLHHSQKKNPHAPVLLTAGASPKNLQARWAEYFPNEVLWLPFINPEEPDGDPIGGLLLARDVVWKPEEQRLLAHWTEAVAYSLQAVSRRRKRLFAKLGKRERMWTAGVAIILFFAAMWFPVRMSVLAPGEVVPRKPSVVRAQIDGVIDKVFVKPSQEVKAGDVLVRLDATALKARLDNVVQGLEIARAERLRAEQASVTDRKASAQLPLFQAKIKKQTAEVAYVQSLLNRIEVRAEQDGVAIVPDAGDLEGLPVKIGQRMLTLANPKEADLEAWLPVGDSLRLPLGSAMEFYLNIDPTSPVDATLRHIDYQAQMSPEGLLAFRVRADFTDDTMPRIGWRGTAKLYGEEVPLYYYLFRRPVAAARQWFGL